MNRLQKTLEDTNLKLGDVATAIMGKSARAMLEALLTGQTDPAVLATLARGRLKAKRAQLEEALVGVLKPHHRFLLAEQLSLIDTLDEAITRISQEIALRLDPPADQPPTPTAKPDQNALPEGVALSPTDHTLPAEEPQLCWAQAIELLCSIPGISQRNAEGIVAEIGVEMSRFPSSRHLARLRWDVSRQSPKRGQTLVGQDPQRQSLAAHSAD